MKKKILAATLGLVASSVQASNWVLVSTTKDATFYIDTDTLKKGPNGTVEYWLKRVNDQPVKSYTENSLTKTASILSVVKCRDRTVATVSYQGISESGDVTDSINFPRNHLTFNAIPPDSTGESQMNFACHYKPSR